MAGAGVTFTGELGKDGASELTLDFGGTAQTWAKLPAFNAFINSAEKAATVTLTAESQELTRMMGASVATARRRLEQEGDAEC